MFKRLFHDVAFVGISTVFNACACIKFMGIAK